MKSPIAQQSVLRRDVSEQSLSVRNAANSVWDFERAAITEQTDREGVIETGGVEWMCAK
jgi:hypothetical protein